MTFGGQYSCEGDNYRDDVLSDVVYVAMDRSNDDSPGYLSSWGSDSRMAAASSSISLSVCEYENP